MDLLKNMNGRSYTSTSRVLPTPDTFTIAFFKSLFSNIGLILELDCSVFLTPE